jgi:hypothetical protein
MPLDDRRSSFRPAKKAELYGQKLRFFGSKRPLFGKKTGKKRGLQLLIRQ